MCVIPAAPCGPQTMSGMTRLTIPASTIVDRLVNRLELDSRGYWRRRRDGGIALVIEDSSASSAEDGVVGALGLKPNVEPRSTETALSGFRSHPARRISIDRTHRLPRSQAEVESCGQGVVLAMAPDDRFTDIIVYRSPVQSKVPSKCHVPGPVR